MRYIVSVQSADRQAVQSFRTYLPVAVVGDYLNDPGLQPGERIIISRPRADTG